MKKLAYSILFLLGFSFLVPSFYSCSVEPDTITIYETDTLIITKNDTIIFNVTDTLIVTDTVNLTEFILDTATTFILIRHADVDLLETDPELNEAGLERVEALKIALENVALTGVFSTDFDRTMQTATPIAEDHSLSVTIYNAFSPNTTTNLILDQHWGEAVLVVGHGNTTPNMLNVLIGSNFYDDLAEDAFNNLFVVSVFEKGRAEVVHLKYGM